MKISFFPVPSPHDDDRATLREIKRFFIIISVLCVCLYGATCFGQWVDLTNVEDTLLRNQTQNRPDFSMKHEPAEQRSPMPTGVDRLGSDGETLLRQRSESGLPVSSTSGGKEPEKPEHTIIIIIDSLSAEQFAFQLDRGDLPNIEREFVNKGLYVENCVTSFPPTSFSAHATIMTGTLPGRHGIVCLRWFDRMKGSNRSYAGFGALLLNKDIMHGIETLYGLFTGGLTTSMGQVASKGVDKQYPPFVPSDTARVKMFCNQLENKHPPVFSTIWLPQLDPVAHKYAPESDRAVEHLKRLDELVGEIGWHLRYGGIYDKTLWVLLADHGQISADKDESIPNFLEQMGFDVLDILYYVMRDEFLCRGYDAVAWGSGVGSYMISLPVKKDNGKIDWKKRPTLKQLRNYPMKNAPIDLVSRLLARESVAFVLARGEEGDICLFGDSGQAVIKVSEGVTTASEITYRIEEGLDPLGYADDARVKHLLDGQPHSAAEWFEATAPTDYPDAPVQLTQIFLNERSPDLLVLAADGWELETSWHLGRHSGYTRREMLVPLLLAGPGLSRQRIQYARNVDLFPTIVQLTGCNKPTWSLDGESLLKK